MVEHGDLDAEVVSALSGEGDGVFVVGEGPVAGGAVGDAALLGRLIGVGEVEGEEVGAVGVECGGPESVVVEGDGEDVGGGVGVESEGELSVVGVEDVECVGGADGDLGAVVGPDEAAVEVESDGDASDALWVDEVEGGVVVGVPEGGRDGECGGGGGCGRGSAFDVPAVGVWDGGQGELGAVGGRWSWSAGMSQRVDSDWPNSAARRRGRSGWASGWIEGDPRGTIRPSASPERRIATPAIQRRRWYRSCRIAVRRAWVGVMPSFSLCR